ncbi:MAG: hypothetical protein DLM63_05870 [Solirubrobacterales bacterium]|nr:MAG: hypothetical protein DLM63_05870 [Solirubrobacterales bacterium]
MSERYVPAAGRPVLTPLFDAVNAVTMRQRHWRPLLVEHARAAGARQILDLGCGTGAMAIALAHDLPAAKVMGIDGDPAVLRRARAKAAKVGVEIELHEALADAIPLAAVRDPSHGWGHNLRPPLERCPYSACPQRGRDDGGARRRHRRGTGRRGGGEHRDACSAARGCPQPEGFPQQLDKAG